MAQVALQSVVPAAPTNDKIHPTAKDASLLTLAPAVVPTEVQLERQRRKETLAATMRIFSKQNFDHYASGHASIRDPEYPDTFWLNPFGLPCSLTTVSDLVRVDKAGKVLEGGKPGRQTITAAGAIIDAGIYQARPELNAICHAHPPHATAFSTLGIPFDFITHDSCVFYDDISFYGNFGGVVLAQEEGDRIVKALGNKKAVLLQNHGPLTVGETLQSAVLWLIMLERECQVQLLAGPAAAQRGIKPIPVEKEEAEYTRARLGIEETGIVFAQPYFQAIEAECGVQYKA